MLCNCVRYTAGRVGRAGEEGEEEGDEGWMRTTNFVPVITPIQLSFSVCYIKK